MDLHAGNSSHSGKPRLDWEFEACLSNMMRPPPPQFGGKKKQPAEMSLFLYLQMGLIRLHKHPTCLLRAKGNTTAESLIRNRVPQVKTEVKSISQTTIPRKPVTTPLIFQLDSFISRNMKHAKATLPPKTYLEMFSDLYLFRNRRIDVYKNGILQDGFTVSKKISYGWTFGLHFSRL